MRKFFLFISIFILPLLGQEQGATNLIDKLKLSSLENSTAPTPSESITLFQVDIEYESDQVYQDIQQGFGHLLGFWDIQAYRFFLKALTVKEDSIMATSGIVMSLLSSRENIFKEQREAAISHLYNLVENQEGTKFEKDFGTAVLALCRGDRIKWNRILGRLADSSEKDGLAKLLHAYYSRDGYNPDGTPKVGQQETIDKLNSMLEQSPTEPAFLLFNVTARLENPKPTKKYGKKVIELVESLEESNPGFAPYYKLKGFCTLRVGDPFKALGAYTTAAELYETYLQEENIPLRHCTDLIESRIGEIYALILQENYESANMLTHELINKNNLDSDSPRTLLNYLYEWEVDTFPLRIALISNNLDSVSKKVETLRQKLSKVQEKRLSHLCWEALILYADFRLMEESGDMTKLGNLLQDFTNASLKYQKPTIDNYEAGAIAQWQRGGALLKTLEAEIFARYELKKKTPDHTTFQKHMENAISSQKIVSSISPPFWPAPIGNLQVEHLMGLGNYQDAFKVAQVSYRLMPNHYPTMLKLREILEKLDRPEDAEKVNSLIKTFEKKKN